MEPGQQKSNGPRYPRLERHHGVGQEHNEQDLPDTLHSYFLGLHPQRPRGEGALVGGREDGKRHEDEGGAEEENGVAHPQEVGVVEVFGVEEN